MLDDLTPKGSAHSNLVDLNSRAFIFFLFRSVTVNMEKVISNELNILIFAHEVFPHLDQTHARTNVVHLGIKQQPSILRHEMSSGWVHVQCVACFN